MKDFIKKVSSCFSLYGVTVFAGIVITLCLIAFGEQYYYQLQPLFEKYNFKLYLILVLCIAWLFFYIVYLHKQVVDLVKFVISENIITRKNMSKLNRETRKLIVLHTTSKKEDEVG